MRAAREQFVSIARVSPSVRRVATVAGLTLAIVSALHLRLSALHHVAWTQRPVDEATVPSPRAIRTLSLGHTEWAANLLWVAGLVYFGSSVAQKTPQQYLQRYADTIEAIDPQFRAAYLWAATVSMYNTRIIRRESVEHSNEHLRRGLRLFPHDGEMLYQLGFNLYFELPAIVTDAGEQSEFRRRGAEYLRQAASVGYGPTWMGLAAAGALLQAGLTDQAIEHLRDLYLRTEDEDAKRRIEGQMRHLLAERAAGPDPSLEAARTFDQERRGSFPYVPPVLYLFVGPAVPAVRGVTSAPMNSVSTASE